MLIPCCLSQLKADVAGLQLILIGDIHSLPMLDLNLRKFSVDVRDWSGDVSVSSAARGSPY